MRSRIGIVSTVLALALLSLPVAPARASFHEILITEVFIGPPDHSDAQYVELTTIENGQTNLGGETLRLFNKSGQQIGSQTLADLPGAADDQSEILIASDAFANLFTGVTRDFELEFSLPRQGGKLCFADDIDCFAWGNYAGPSTDVGRPFPSLIPGSAVRRISGFEVTDPYDRGDDDNSSRNDFFLFDPSPRSTETGSDTTGEPIGGVIALEVSGYSFTEGEFGRDVVVLRTVDTSLAAAAELSIIPKSAEPGQDYDEPSPNPIVIPFGTGDGEDTPIVQINDDSVLEPTEVVILQLRNPSGGAVLGGVINSSFVIQDNEPDPFPPTSRITKPGQGTTHLELTRIRGTSSDVGHGVNRVRLALRRNMTNGTCRWLRQNGDFQQGPCGTKVFFVNLSAFNPKWVSPPFDPLASSQGTNTRNYTAFSRATDFDSNVEQGFERGRNANTFEVR